MKLFSCFRSNSSNRRKKKVEMEIDKSSKSNNFAVNQSTDHFQQNISNRAQNVKEQQLAKENVDELHDGVAQQTRSLTQTREQRSTSYPKKSELPSNHISRPSKLTKPRASTSVAEVNRSISSDLESKIDLINEEAGKKRSKTVVSEYYEKLGELLENFKIDRERIKTFQDARTRQRLMTSASTTPNDVNEQIDRQLDQLDEQTIEHLNEPHPPNDNCNDRSSHQQASPPIVRHLSVFDTETRRNSSKPNQILQMTEENESEMASRLANITFFVNFALLLAKVIASALSGSISIISSMVDSLVDLTSGFVISVSSKLIKERDPYLYPRGRAQLEPISLILISVIMGLTSIQLIIQSAYRIHEAFLYDFYGKGEEPTLDMGWPTVLIMISTICIKFGLFLICQKNTSDSSIAVLAMDHRNDCISNSIALVCAWLANKFYYYLDPIGAIFVSFYILHTWVQTGKEHILQLSGKSADPEFINRIIKVCIDHDERIEKLDTVYVYHYGTKFLVEVHIVLNEEMPLRIAHDISEDLQINIESLPDVERAFVHIDYEFEHKPQDEHIVS